MMGSAQARYAAGGRQLASARGAAGVAREKAAAVAAVKQSTYRNWENGFRRPSHDQFLQLAVLLWRGQVPAALACAGEFALRIGEEEIKEAVIAPIPTELERERERLNAPGTSMLRG